MIEFDLIMNIYPGYYMFINAIILWIKNIYKNSLSNLNAL